MWVKPLIQDSLRAWEISFVVCLFYSLPLTHLERMCEGRRKENYDKTDEEYGSENPSREN